jgi:hypothetical protein
MLSALHVDETTVQILHYDKAENEEEAEKDKTMTSLICGLHAAVWKRRWL